MLHPQRSRNPLRALVGTATVLITLGSLVAASTAAPSAPDGAALKLRGDLAAQVAGVQQQDPRVGRLVAGYRPGELAYFAVLTEPNDAKHEAAVTALGARVLRRYRSVHAFALASSATTVLRVAALPWVKWLTPVEVVVPLAHEQEVDQRRGTPADVGATPWWSTITGEGVRIAVIDTGLDSTHQDLDDLDFRHWSSALNPRKVVDARDFNGGVCKPIVGLADGNGHGTHVAGIATGTGEGTPLAEDNGKHAGVAPGAELAVGKALTDAGAGINSDLVAAMEWAALPHDPSPAGCSVGADIVNMSVGSDARPTRLNSGSDVDFVSYVLNRLAVRYGTLFVGAAGNSGPYIGSMLEAPGSAAQALSVGAAAKDWDLNHDDTASGDPCSGWTHDDPPSDPSIAPPCGADPSPLQPPSLAGFSSRGPSGDVWLRPDIVAPGYQVVAPQSATGAVVAGQDLNPNTRTDPLYATASGTSMAAPATAGSAALVLAAYRARHGGNPTGTTGVTGLSAPKYALLRAALMNTAGGDLYEARSLVTTDFAALKVEPRNGPADPYVGPLAEGAGKIDVGRAIAALRDGLVVYSAATAGADAGTGNRELQGSWQIGAIPAGTARAQRFVLHKAPGTANLSATFGYGPGHPSDGSLPLLAAWVTPPAATSVTAGDAIVTASVSIPAAAPAGMYTGVLRVTASNGQALRVPVFASVALHDPDVAAGNAPGPQARIASARDVFSRGDTIWPSIVGAANGSAADWLVYPVELGAGLSEARFTVYDADAGDETYDLYLYDDRFDLVATTHPLVEGVTDPVANSSRGATPPGAPAQLVLRTPARGRHYVVVSRAKTGLNAGDFGRFVLTLDEVRAQVAPAPTELAYEGDFVFTQGQAGRLAARLTDAAGDAVAGREVRFTFDDPPVSPCPGGVCSAVTDYRGLAQLATDPIALATGVHEVQASFAGDAFWLPSSGSAFVLVVGPGGGAPPPAGSGSGKITAGGWFVPDGRQGGKKNDLRVHFAFHATGTAGVAPTGELKYRDDFENVDVELVGYTALAVNGDEATLTGTARHADGRTSSFALTARDRGEPGKGNDTLRFRLLDSGYDRAGTLGGGNLQLHRS